MQERDKLPAFRFEAQVLPYSRTKADPRASFHINCELELPDAPVPQAAIQYRGHLMGGMAVLRRDMCAHRLVRDERHIQASQNDHYCLRVPLSPTGVPEALASGPVFADMERPLQVDLPAGADVLVFVPREALNALLPRRLDLHGAAPAGPSGEMLAEFVRALAGRMDWLHAGEARALSQAVLHMMAAALGPISDSLPLAQGANDSLLVRRIGHFIDEHLPDPDLSPSQLCRAFRLSRSTLFRVLGPQGGPATFIRERRLAHAHALLSLARHRQYLKRTAADCGFKDASHFSRAFRLRYGYSPREALDRRPLTVPTALAKDTAPEASPIAAWLQCLRP